LVVLVTGCTAKSDKADMAARKGDYAKAVELYREALEKDNMKAPEMAEARYNLGKVLDKMSRLDEAVEEYRLAVELKPDNIKYYMAMADDLDAMGLIEQEVIILRNASILDNANPHVRSMLGTAYAKLGQYTNAKTEFEAALKLNSRDPQNHVNMGLIYDKEGNPAKAIESMENALKVSPDFDPAMMALGAMYTRLGKYQDSVKIYKKLASSNPSNLKYRNSLGIAYYNNAQYGEALKEFKGVAKDDPNFPGIQDFLRLADRGNKLAGTKAKK
jgi:tetratricopeptide (TPR) repeat protein